VELLKRIVTVSVEIIRIVDGLLPLRTGSEKAL